MSGTNFRGVRKLSPKPSAFESEIHPTHKPSVYASGISPCRGQICASANLQSERAGLYLSMPSQRTGRMDAVDANDYIFETICSNIRGTLWKPPLRLSESDSREPLGYGHESAISWLIAAAHRKSGSGRLPGREKVFIYEKKFIYRNGEAA